MRLIKVLATGLMIALGGLEAPAVFAQDGQEEPVVREIVVEGNNRIEAATVLSYMVLKIGDPFDPGRMDESLKSLFATGLFSDVSIRREGARLIVRVVENPIINRVAFEGNSKIDDEDLAAEIQLRPRVVYTRTKVQTDVQRILDLYRVSGRFAATVDPKVIPLTQNRVDLVFEISEGDVTGIRRISFVGNRVFSDGELRSEIQTAETAWWRFFTSDDTYDPDRLEFDKELLRRFYLSEGYADFRVISAVAELSPERDEFFVTFTLEEGERYKFGTITITTNLRDLDTAPFQEEFEDLEDEWYDADVIEEVISNLTDAAGNLGYAFVEVRPVVDRDPENLRMNITFEINEGPRVFVERIDIVGNERTRDEVIRREMRLAEGDAFNTARLRQSRRRIDNLGFFETVEITNEPGSAPDQTVVTVSVAERSTGELTLGAGFSTQEGAIGTIGLRERNFMGRGQDVGVAFSLSQRTQQLDLTFTEPYFLDRNISAGIDLFRVIRSFDDEGSFNQRTTGGRLRAGYEIVQDLRQNWSYTARRDSITNIDRDASIFIRREAGSTFTSALGHTIIFDRRDSRFDPTAGYFIEVGTEVAGLGGTERYVKGEIKAGTYYSVTEDWVLSFVAEAGKIVGFAGKDVRLADRFFIGGDNFRGFDVAGIGPRDSNTSDALGANEFYVGTAELSFPVGLPKELGIRGRVFSDVGTAGGIDVSGPTLLDKKSLRVSVGAGISWASPFGPVRVDVGFPIIKESFDKDRLFFFSFGTRF